MSTPTAMTMGTMTITPTSLPSRGSTTTSTPTRRGPIVTPTGKTCIIGIMGEPSSWLSRHHG